MKILGVVVLMCGLGVADASAQCFGTRVRVRNGFCGGVNVNVGSRVGFLQRIRSRRSAVNVNVGASSVFIQDAIPVVQQVTSFAVPTTFVGTSSYGYGAVQSDLSTRTQSLANEFRALRGSLQALSDETRALQTQGR